MLKLAHRSLLEDGRGQIMMTEAESYSVAEIRCDREQAGFRELKHN